MKNVIIVNWDFSEGDNSSMYESEDFIVGYSNFRKNSLKLFKRLINSHLENTNSVLVFTHTSYPNEVSAEDLGIVNSKLKIDNVSGGNHFLYGDDGLIHISVRGKSFNEMKLYYGESFFNNAKIVWNSYFGGRLLEIEKKKLIDTFLPLALDSQGLKEKETEPEKKETYLKEILSDIEKNAGNISQNWNEIKRVLGLKISGNEPINEDLSKSWRFNDDEKNKLYPPFEDKNEPGILKEKLIEYFNNHNNQEGENYLPDWLKQAVEVIENKIKSYKTA